MRALQISPEDSVATLIDPAAVGDSIAAGDRSIVALADIPRGHKIAGRPVARGDKVLKYGAPIGSATAAIRPGEHVHLHNLASDYTPSHVIASTAGRVS